MNIALFDRPVREENESALIRRWELVCQDERNRLDLGMDFEFAKVLKALDRSEVCRAASTSIPLFRIGVDAHAMENMLSSTKGLRVPPDVDANGVVRENEELLLNRWNAAVRGDLKSFIRWALPRTTAAFLRRCTLGDVRRLAALGHPMCRLQVKSAYIWHAAKARHLGDVQRDAFALSSTVLNCNV